MKVVKLSKRVFNGDLVKLYRKFNLIRVEGGVEHARTGDLLCSEATGKLMRTSMKEWAKKSKRNQHLRGKALDSAIGWEWLNLGPSYDNTVPLGYLKINTHVILPDFL